MKDKEFKKLKVGLALGGGGAKGLAHIGVIKALEAAGIKIDFISGTSMGSLIGGFYAATGDVRVLEELFLKLKKGDIFPMSKLLRKRDGNLFRDKSIIELLEADIKGVKIKDCKIPFAAVATDVKNGEDVIIKKGSLTDAIRASSALPVVFAPVSMGGKLLMDGGFSNPVPADVCRDMGAEIVIAVDVSSISAVAAHFGRCRYCASSAGFKF
ncbi:patatin-like phospholipase family protein [Candidatus Wolfebacteria bacterium]|nr:patatin-like phospholipase family protein [Candidatus Wolfebacteria bacterium]